MKIYYIKYKTILLISIIFIALILLFISLNLNNNIETFKNKDNVYYKGNTNKNEVAFVCNVDWGEDLIPEMLKLFDEKDIKITFFVTGKWAEKNPKLLLKMYNEGHEIGSHGYFHRNYGDLSYKVNYNEIDKSDKIIKKIIGKKPTLFAPPSGSYNKHTINAASKLNYKVIMWSVDTIDWRKDSTKKVIVKRVLSKIDNGSIVLMHPKEETIKALPIIIDSIKKDNLQITTVSEVLQ